MTATSENVRLTTVRNIPERVKLALIDDATRQGQSVADTATQILAEALKVPSPRGGRRTGPHAHADTELLQLRVSERLHAALWLAARRARTTQSRFAISVWAAYYDIPYDPHTGGTT